MAELPSKKGQRSKGVFKLPSAEVIIATKAKEIEKDAELAKSKYSKLIFDYARKNSSFSRTLRMHGLDYLHRLHKPANPDQSDVTLIQIFEKSLDLDRVAINLHEKSLDELGKDKELRFKESLIGFKKRTEKYHGIFDSANSLLVNFQSLVSKKNSVPFCLIEEKLNASRLCLRSKLLEVERVYLDVFEGTSIMSGMVPERTEEDAQMEPL